MKYCVGPVTGGVKGVYVMFTTCPVNEYRPFCVESKKPLVMVTSLPVSAYEPLDAVSV